MDSNTLHQEIDSIAYRMVRSRSGVKGVDFSDLLCRLISRNPQLSTHEDIKGLMAGALNQLTRSGRWRTVPLRDNLWKTTWRGLPLPKRLIYQELASGEKADAHAVAWHPFLASRIQGKLTNTIRDKLICLNNYLRDRTNQQQPLFEGQLSHRERSLMIFGDEKALDNMPSEGWKSVTLTLADLHCYRQAPPLPHSFHADAATQQRPIIIIENSDTYYRIVHRNQIEQNWSAVVYGSGNLIASQTDSVAELAHRVGNVKVMYCGDIDRNGFKIANSLRNNLAQVDIELALETSLYREMIESPYKVAEKEANSGTFDVNGALWIDAWIRDAFESLVTMNKRIPQEAIQ